MDIANSYYLLHINYFLWILQQSALFLSLSLIVGPEFHSTSLLPFVWRMHTHFFNCRHKIVGHSSAFRNVVLLLVPH